MATLTTLQGYQKRVYDTCRANGLTDLHAKIIASQATHESGNFKSSLFKRANNIFGMTIPAKRPKTYISGDAGKQPDGNAHYAAYSSLENSVRDLLSWHTYNKTDWNKITDGEAYAKYLKQKGYYGATLAQYTAAILRNIPGLSFLGEGLVAVAGNPVSIIPVLLIVGILFLIFKR